MPRTPIEMILDGVAWIPTENTTGDGSLPYATHEGVLEIGDVKLKCYRLNTGQAIFDESDFIKFFEGLAGGKSKKGR